MRCPSCGVDVKEEWKFCPRCGFILEKRRDLFGDVFEKMEREFKEMGKMFERDFEVFDLSPFFRKPLRGKGFSIKISRSMDDKPKVSVKTFGDVDREELEKEVGKLGFKEVTRTREPEREEEVIQLEKVKTTEEPETSVRNVMGRIVVEVKLPGVRDSKDIEVKSMENSIEIKAIAGDKAYFKILTKPQKANIVKKDFEDGVLKIELV